METKIKEFLEETGFKQNTDYDALSKNLDQKDDRFLTTLFWGQEGLEIYALKTNGYRVQSRAEIYQNHNELQSSALAEFKKLEETFKEIVGQDMINFIHPDFR